MILRVSGDVKQIGKDSRGNPFLILGDYRDRVLGVHATIEGGKRVAELSEGSFVVVRCERNHGKTLHVLLDNCTIVN